MSSIAEKERVKTELSDVVKIIYLDDSNSVFSEKKGFISLSAEISDENGKLEKKEYERVFLHRDFPFDMPDKYISVLDKESHEIGIIEDLNLLNSESRRIIASELGRKYYVFKIRSILNINERYGFSYWDVITDDGKIDFTLQDTFRSIMKVNSDRVIITDIDGNRYEIESLSALNPKSFKKIELYL